MSMRTPLVVVISALSLAGCFGRKQSPRPGATPPASAPATAPRAGTATPRGGTPANTPAATPAPAATAPNAALTDANIAAIVIAANEMDISYGRIAAAKSADARVKQFGEMMQRDHGGVNTLASQLATKLRLTPADNQVSLDLRDEAEAKRDTLRELAGGEFNRWYAANEVRYHAMLLETLEGTLIPSARNAELKALLTQVLPTVRAHFRLAAELDRSLRAARR
jgi:putative membrane protein